MLDKVDLGRGGSNGHAPGEWGRSPMPSLVLNSRLPAVAIVLCGTLIALSSVARSQTAPPLPLPPSPPQLSAPAPTVEQLAERLRAAEAANVQQAEQIKHLH